MRRDRRNSLYEVVGIFQRLTLKFKQKGKLHITKDLTFSNRR